MYCEKCGSQMADNQMYCENCGAKAEHLQGTVPGNSPTMGAGDNPSVVPNPAIGNERSSLFYAASVLAVLECVLPFLNWLEIPAFNSFNSWFGGSNDIASYSLFGYVGTLGQTGRMDGFNRAIFTILAGGGALQIVLNAIFLIKGWSSKRRFYKYGTLATVLMLIVSLVFVTIVGLSTAIVQVVEITFVPWIALAASIANIVVIKKLKRQELQV